LGLELELGLELILKFEVRYWPDFAFSVAYFPPSVWQKLTELKLELGLELGIELELG